MLCCGLLGTLYLCYLRTWAQDVHCTVGVCGKFDMLCCGLLGKLCLVNAIWSITIKGTAELCHQNATWM